ncbi:carbohydrate sulfotransferase 8-like [Amblyomma americanum]
MRKAAWLLLAALLLVAAAWLRNNGRLHSLRALDSQDNTQEAWSSEQARRVRLLREACSSGQQDRDLLGPHYLGSRSNRRRGRPTHCPPRLCPIFVDDRRKVAFCFVPKVASTSVKSLFAALLGINATSGHGAGDGDDALHALFNERVFRIGPTHWAPSKLRQYTRVLFVRHPFERLVSAFEDKAGRPRDKERFFYDVYWDRIAAATGRNATNGASNSSESPGVSFTQFVDYLLRVPVTQWDDHWAPYYSRCEPCLFGYDFVGHLETAAQDLALLWQRMGLPPLNSSLLTRRNATPRRHKRYFDQLTASQVEGLYRRYFYDFVLFGYDQRVYVASGKS